MMITFKKFLESKEDDEDENKVYFFSRNRYRSITSGSIKELKNDYITILSGRTDIIRWVGVCTKTFDECEKLKDILDKVEWWDKTVSNTSPSDYKKLMSDILKQRKDKKIEDIKF